MNDPTIRKNLVAVLASVQVLCEELDKEIRKPDAELSRTTATYLTRQLQEKARRVNNTIAGLCGQSQRARLLKRTNPRVP
jgi:hypothetical protein